MLDESTLEYYFDIKSVQLDMVRDRGYIIFKHEDLGIKQLPVNIVYKQ